MARYKVFDYRSALHDLGVKGEVYCRCFLWSALQIFEVVEVSTGNSCTKSHYNHHTSSARFTANTNETQVCANTKQ